MTDAMVTARMSRSKKEAGGRVFASLGTTASGAINDLYDYVISKRKLPFETASVSDAPTREDLAKALAWVDGIAQSAPGELSSMSLKEAKRHRLVSKGLLADEEASA